MSYECGEDFCDVCGDCMACFGSEFCALRGDEDNELPHLFTKED